MKLKLLLVILIFLQVQSRAQVNLQFNGINEYMFSTKEALNFTVVYSGTTPVDVRFTGKIANDLNNVVVEFTSNPTVLNPGANVFSPVSLGFDQLNYLNSEIAEIELKTGTYPSGAYRICVQIFCIQPDCNGAGQNAVALEMPSCTYVNVENPTPLLLAYPHDNSETDETRPLYNWIPPAPVAGIGGLQYTMTLVEINEGQNKADALAMNRPLIEMEGINANSLMHPSDIPDLVPGHTYAWQVKAFVGSTFIAKSEQWQFKVKKEKKKKFGKSITTLKLDYNVNPYFIKQTDTLVMLFEQNYHFEKDVKWDITLIDEFSGKIVSLDFNVITDIFAGLNGIQLLPVSGMGLADDKAYRFELRNLKGDIYYVRIIFKN